MDPGDKIGAAPRRVILIGASNLVIGLPQVLEAAWRHWGRPLEVLAAIGHGRSYGHSSRVLWRGLSGIVECGLWEALARRPAAPTAALVTDIGNDILFGVPAETIAAWVETCLRRLAACSSSLLVTALPLGSVAKIGTRRFGLMRRLLFPQSRLPLEAVRETARELNGRVEALARRYAARVVTPPADWYGFDPIHIRRSLRSRAWLEILGQWEHARAAPPQRVAWREWWRLRRVKPQRRALFGREQHHTQPAAVFADGTSIALY